MVYLQVGVVSQFVKFVQVGHIVKVSIFDLVKVQTEIETVMPSESPCYLRKVVHQSVLTTNFVRLENIQVYQRCF